MLNVLFFLPAPMWYQSKCTNSYRAWTTKYIMFIKGLSRHQVFLWTLIAKSFQCLLHLQEGAHEQDQFSQDIGMTCGPPAFSFLPWELGRFHRARNFELIWWVIHLKSPGNLWRFTSFWPPLGHCHESPMLVVHCHPSLPRESRAEAPVNHIVSESWYTPPNINMCPKRGPFQRERIDFQPQFFSGHVSHHTWHRRDQTMNHLPI